MNQLNIRLGYRVHTKSVHKIIPLLICSECNTGMQVSRHDNRDQFKKREREGRQPKDMKPNKNNNSTIR